MWRKIPTSFRTKLIVLLMCAGVLVPNSVFAMITRTLTIGATGPDVVELQNYLITNGYLSLAAPTGYFGPITRAAVYAMQNANNVIPVTGTVGPITLGIINGLTNAVSLTLVADDMSVDNGGSTVIRWYATNANTCTSPWTSSQLTSGQFVTSKLFKTTTFYMLCGSGNGNVVESVTVEVRGSTASSITTTPTTTSIPVVIPPTSPRGSPINTGSQVAPSFVVGQTVAAAKTPTEVLRSAGGGNAGLQAAGVLGIIKDQPSTVSGKKYWWINFATGVDGWVLDGDVVFTTEVLSLNALTSSGENVLPNIPQSPFATTSGAAGVMVNSGPLSVRTSASLTSSILGSQPANSVGFIIAGPVFVDGYSWYKIDYLTGTDGWSASQYLSFVPPSSIGLGSGAITSPPTYVATATYVGTGIALDWNDPRVRWWIRADKTNQEIGSKFAYTGVQGSVNDCNYDVIQNTPEPNMWNGRVVLQRSGGWFQHRIWDGMCLWNGQRQRSAIHTSDAYGDISSVKRGHEYWMAFGGKFYPDLFSQTDPSEDRAIQLLDFHHKAPSSALSGQSPWTLTADQNGYNLRFLWNRSDSGVTSPTGETHWDGTQRVTMLRDTSKDTTNPHFFLLHFVLDWDINAPKKPFVELYRQIGVDGAISMIGRWDVPNTYSGSDDLVFPKYGLHQWYPTLSGQPTRSIDMAGAIIVEALPGAVPLTPENLFASLTVAIPR